MSVLSEILATKRTEVTLLREKTSLQQMQEQLIDAPPVRGFRDALIAAEAPALIAEVKKASPSRGVIREDFHPVEIAQSYKQGGAACLSVLTDEPYFQGSLQYLREIRHSVELPVLRKDFLLDPWQLLESRVSGADAVLLIAAALSTSDLRSLLRQTREMGMDALVEVHDGEELVEALDAGADIIGINNRNLHTFGTSLQVTLQLASSVKEHPEVLLVSESGIFHSADVACLKAAGVDAVLVGEALMKEADVEAAVRKLLGR